jgi:hypothetical protein
MQSSSVIPKSNIPAQVLYELQFYETGRNVAKQ